MTQFGRRKDGPGGRRGAPREPVRLNAALLAVGCSRGATLLDLSCKGARLRIPPSILLHPGQQLWLKLSTTEIFGSVRWTCGETCGIAFDEPLSEAQAAALQARGRVVPVAGLPEEDQLAAEDLEDKLAPYAER